MFIKTHQKLLQCHNKKITCKIEGEYIEDAEIFVDDDKIYVCQNVQDGMSFCGRLGYKYSWLISRDNDTYEENNAKCTEIKLVENLEKKTNSILKDSEGGTYNWVSSEDFDLEGIQESKTVSEGMSNIKKILEKIKRVKDLHKYMSDFTPSANKEQINFMNGILRGMDIMTTFINEEILNNKEK